MIIVKEYNPKQPKTPLRKVSLNFRTMKVKVSEGIYIVDNQGIWTFNEKWHKCRRVSAGIGQLNKGGANYSTFLTMKQTATEGVALIKNKIYDEIEYKRLMLKAFEKSLEEITL